MSAVSDPARAVETADGLISNNKVDKITNE